MLVLILDDIHECFGIEIHRPEQVVLSHEAYLGHVRWDEIRALIWTSVRGCLSENIKGQMLFAIIY